MSLSVGIVGLPNSGKSTLFNALAARRLSSTAVHPFTTIEPYEAVVSVPDKKLKKLSGLLGPEKTTPATVNFIDIAGLVRDAHKGEGLGNQFLAKIREADAVIQVLRTFENSEVSHYYQTIDPGRDLEIVNLELELAGIKKPMIYVLNVGEKEVEAGPAARQPQNLPTALTSAGPHFGAPRLASPAFLVVCAKLEEELADLSPEERKEYLQELGIKESGLEKLIREAYKLLNLITFYTIKGGKEVRAWSLKAGQMALEAAERVHTDFAKNFIKAEVINVDELLRIGGWHQAKEQGRVRLEGRDYPVQDGDVIEFKIGS